MEGGRVITVGSSRIERWQLRRGDHIYCWRGRCGFSYSHHGIYESHCKVIQFCSPNTGSPSSLLSSFSPTRSCPECAAAERRGGVVISCLDCFQENDNICLFAYSVPPWFRNMLLSCTTIPTCLVERADDPETVLRRANNKLASGFGSYDLLTNNCVDFAIYCKTGRYDVLARFN